MKETNKLIQHLLHTHEDRRMKPKFGYFKTLIKSLHTYGHMPSCTNHLWSGNSSIFIELVSWESCLFLTLSRALCAAGASEQPCLGWWRSGRPIPKWCSTCGLPSEWSAARNRSLTWIESQSNFSHSCSFTSPYFYLFLCRIKGNLLTWG